MASLTGEAPTSSRAMASAGAGVHNGTLARAAATPRPACGALPGAPGSMPLRAAQYARPYASSRRRLAVSSLPWIAA
jgi:hypothetical protein